MTRYKSYPAAKKSPLNSIPIKYQYIVDILGDIEKIQRIHIFFDSELGKTIGVHQPGWNGRRLKGGASELSSFIEIVRISYSPYMESSVLNEVVELSAWSINIRSCTKKDAVKANMLLVNVILPIVKEWLNKQKTDVWYINRQNLQIGFNKEMSEYCILEIQEGKIIKKVIKEI